MIHGWAWTAASAITVTAATHSMLGERRLITPLLMMHQGILGASLARKLLRFAWHFTSMLMLSLAFALVVLADQEGRPARLVFAATGSVFLGVGLFDAIYTRGRHVGWPLLVGSGVAAMLALS